MIKKVLETLKRIIIEFFSFVALILLLFFALVWLNLLMFVADKFKGTKIEKCLYGFEDFIELVVEKTARGCEKFIDWFKK